MIMELPRDFKISSAEVIGEELFIYSLKRYEDLMYELTYALREGHCVYCGARLNKTNSTLDHRYPRDTGGISIVNNLFPCCSCHNSQKGNLTHQEYMEYKNLSKKDRKEYLKKFEKRKKRIMQEIGFKLPRKWVTYEEIGNINYSQQSEELRGKRYHRILEFYNNYHKLPKPVVVDKNNMLLDGYNIILFARDFEIQRIPIIKLENVERVERHK